MNLNQRFKFTLLLTVFFLPLPLFAQTNSFAQFWNELQFTRPIKNKWTGEINFSQTTSATSGDRNPFSRYIQFMVRGWGHYYASPRWKVSGFLAYYHNFEIAELGQVKHPEVRFAGQGIYYIKKTRFTLSTRTRIEVRLIKKEQKFNDAYRYRQQLKLVYPFNSKIIRKGVVYGIASGELFFKIPGDVTGDQFFDRTRFTAGAGYSITDDIQMELTYVNEFLPRPDSNELYNVLQLNFTFNNLFRKLNKKVKEIFHHESDE